MGPELELLGAPVGGSHCPVIRARELVTELAARPHPAAGLISSEYSASLSVLRGPSLCVFKVECGAFSRAPAPYLLRCASPCGSSHRELPEGPHVHLSSWTRCLVCSGRPDSASRGW